MQDADTIRLYPDAAVICTVVQDGIAIQTLPVCSGNPSAICTVQTGIAVVIEGADYKATAEHDLVLNVKPSGCIQNGVLVVCYSDPMGYVVPAGPIPANRQFTDLGQVTPSGVAAIWIPSIPGDNSFFMATSAETQFQTAQVLPFVLHAKAGDKRDFTLNGNQNANWTFTGVAGTTVPIAPSQGTSITFQAPSTVPVQQQDTLTACKVDTSHGTDCNSAQIIVEVLKVSIDPPNPSSNPPVNPNELLGGEIVKYKATVVQGGQIVNLPVNWILSQPPGLNFVSLNAADPTDGTVTVQPQSAFQGADFIVTLQAWSPFDRDVSMSAPFAIHIPTTTVQITTTPTPGLNEPPFEAKENTDFNFEATVTGPQDAENRLVVWGQKVLTFLGDPGSINPVSGTNKMVYKIPSVPPTQPVTVQISACVGGSFDAFHDPVNEICDTFPFQLAPPVHLTSTFLTVNGGESIPVTVTGTGFGAAPRLSFADSIISFTPTSTTGPDANGVTTITGTISVPPIPIAGETTTMTITSSLPPPTSPGTQPIRIHGEVLTPSVIPVTSTVLITQTQRFTGSLACKTINGLSCSVPQTFTCSITPAIGTMDPSTCTYTAPSSLTAATTVTGQACSTFGNQCASFSISLVPVSVAVSPATVSLDSAQTQQFQATVTNAPNNNQGVTWSINPAVGSISISGLYTAPSAITTNQTITVSACSVIAPANCATGTINLFPPDFALSVPINASVSNPALSSVFDISLVPLHGFSGSVTLSAAVPAGIGMSANFSTTVIAGSGIAVLTVPVLSSTPVGTYNVTITGTSAGLVHTVPITVTVDLASVTVTVSPPQTAPAGTAVSFTFNVTNTGFINVSDGLNITGVPPGSTVTPIAWGGSGGATLTFTTDPTLAPGTYQITITATANGLAGSAVTSLTIPAPPPPPPPPPPPTCTGRNCLNQCSNVQTSKPWQKSGALFFQKI
jgi:hypothetical protein